MTLAIEAAIFDMDGLMLDTETMIKPCFLQAAAELGCPVEDAFYDSLIGLGSGDTNARLAERFGDALPRELLQQRLTVLWRQRVEASGIGIKAGVHDLLDLLARYRLPTAMATSTESEDALFCLRRSGLAERFDAIVCGDHVTRGKPQPDIYLLAAARLGVAPDRCVAFEDSNNGVLAASRAGMRVVMVPDVVTEPSAEAVAAAWRLLPSLTDAAGELMPWLERVRSGRDAADA